MTKIPNLPAFLRRKKKPPQGTGRWVRRFNFPGQDWPYFIGFEENIKNARGYCVFPDGGTRLSGVILEEAESFAKNGWVEIT